jgi:hypothetical protein
MYIERSIAKSKECAVESYWDVERDKGIERDRQIERYIDVNRGKTQKM